MKKIRLFGLAMCVMLILSACGKADGTASSTDRQNTSESEIQIAELENEKLKETDFEKEQKKIEKEIASWKDDTVIAFSDKSFLEQVRRMTGVTERDITYGDVKDITEWTGSYTNIASLKYFTGLRKLTIESKDGDMSPLAYLTELENLTINGDVSDISGLEGLTKLKSLTVQSGSIDDDLSPLAGLVELTYLYINTTTDDLSPLGNLSSLEKLEITGDSISDLSPLGNLSSLETLKITGDSISDVSPIGKLGNLTSLNIGGGQIEDISAFSGLTSLQSLTLRQNGVKDVSALASLESLSSLEIGNMKVTDIQQLADIPNLFRLSFTTEAETLENLHGLDNIQELYISGDNLKTVSDIGDMENLEFLRIAGANLKTAINIGNMGKMYSLDIGGDDFVSVENMPNLVSLGTNRSLKQLSISGCGSLTDFPSDPEGFDLTITIEDLTIDNCDGLTEIPDDIDVDKLILSNNNDLTEVDLSQSKIDELNLINCDALVAITGTRAASLTSLTIQDCDALEVCPLGFDIVEPPFDYEGMGTALKSITIKDCENFRGIDIAGIEALENLTFENLPNMDTINFYLDQLDTVNIVRNNCPKLLFMTVEERYNGLIQKVDALVAAGEQTEAINLMDEALRGYSVYTEAMYGEYIDAIEEKIVEIGNMR